MDDQAYGSDFDSDAAVEVEPVTDPWASAGLRSIDKMLENAFKDRLESKKVSKSLVQAAENPRTAYQQALWRNRFKAHRAQRGVVGDPTPTAEDIERFLTTILSNTAGRSESESVPSFSWLAGGLNNLIVTLIFEYSQFKLTAHDRSRIKATLVTHLNSGKLTRSPARAKRWVGAALIRSMVQAAFQSALDEGTRAWDCTIVHILTMVLGAAIQVRQGDITTIWQDRHELPYLAYQDVSVRLVNGDGIEHLQALVLIRNEKGDKNNPARNRKVLLKSLSRPEDNVVCPIRLLLIIALRTGNVASTTVEQLLASMSRRQDKALVWVHGTRPVIPMVNHHGSTKLHIEKAATNSSLRTVIDKFAAAAGLLERVRVHDLRRGAAKDTRKLVKAGMAFDQSNVGLAMGHNPVTVAKGITQAYAVDYITDTWTARTNEAEEDPFGIARSSEMYKKTKLSSSEVNVRMDLEGVARDDVSKRVKVRRIMQEENLESWRLAQKEAARDVVDRPGDAGPAPQRKRKRSTTVEIAPTDSNDSHGAGDSIPIDPQLIDRIGDVLSPTSRNQTDDTMEEVAYDIVSEFAPAASSLLLLEPAAFVTHFSRINIALSGSTHGKGINVDSGNSRDPPTAFLHHCPNRDRGCTFSHKVPSRRDVHALTCVVYDLKCPHENCDMRPLGFPSRKSLNSHIQAYHNFNPRKCSRKGCESTEIFTTFQALTKHKTDKHSPAKLSWESQYCPIDPCGRQEPMDSEASLRGHLKMVHSLTSTQCKAIIAPLKASMKAKHASRLAPSDDDSDLSEIDDFAAQLEDF